MMFKKNGKPLTWSWASKHLASSRNYWLATVTQRGMPHVMPVWGLWLDNAFYFSTGPRSKKARNLESNQHCTICGEKPDEAVILEGIAEKIAGPSIRPMLKAYERKYDWKVDESQGPFYKVRPKVVFGILEDGSANPTRWSFSKAK